MSTSYFDQEAINALKERLTWIQVLGSEKKVYISAAKDNLTEDDFKPVKAVSLLEFENDKYKLLDIGFQYKGIGRTLVIRNVCAFNWQVLTRSASNIPESIKLTLFCLTDNASPGKSMVPKKYILNFVNCPNEHHISDDYVMMSDPNHSLH